MNTIPLLLLSALIQVESGGVADSIRHDARGRPLEVGILQISEVCVKDVNRILKEDKYKWPLDCLDPIKSEEIFRVYIGHYATEKRLKRKPTFSDIVRIWNGGPDGHKKAVTLRHWQKVHLELSKGK